MSPSTPANESGTALRDLASGAAAALRRPLQAVAFWAAVVLPFLYLPLLARGFADVGEAVVFVVLLGLNAAALVLGHDHGR